MNIQLLLVKNYDVVRYVLLVMLCFLFWDNKNKIVKEKIKYKKIIDVGVLIFITTMASMMFDLCPIRKRELGIDSSVFLYIGKMMHNGLVPYKDMFDHKGPILYFIQYLGIGILENGFIGVWILEFVNMFATVVILFKIAGLITKDRIIRYLSVFASVVICVKKLYQGGNFTEEYALPWISLALYIFLRYIKQKKYNKKDIILLGLSMSVVAMLRLNMITVWIVFVLIILVQFIIEKRWNELLKCIGIFITGMMIIALPILVYTMETNSFNDMIDYYFKFNFEYCGDRGNLANYIKVIDFFIDKMKFAVVTIVISFIFNIKNKIYMFNFLALIASFALAIISGNTYQHYAIVLVPCLVIPVTCFIINLYLIIAMILRKIVPSVIKKIFKRLKISGIAIVFVCICILASQIEIELRSNTYRMHYISRYIVNNSTAKDNVLVVGNAVKYYLYTERQTTNKFFYQYPPIRISDKIYKEFIEEIDNDKPDLIVMIVEKELIEKEKNNMGKVYRKLYKMSEDGVYEFDDRDTYCVYKLKDKNTEN